MNLGKAIKTIRKQSGLTQGDLAERTGLSQTSLSKIEGGVTPSEKSLKKIAEALKVPPSLIYILGMEAGDVAANKKEKFELLFPAIKSLALQIVDMEEEKEKAE